MKRTVMHVAVGMLAGAVLLGVPGYALAKLGADSGGEGSHMEQMMSEPHLRADMKSMMSDMMRDPRLRKQMQDMMREAMGKMPTAPGGGMPMKGTTMGMSRR